MNKLLWWMIIVVITLANYKLAKVCQSLILNFFPQANYELSMSIPWVLIALIPSLLFAYTSGLIFDRERIQENFKHIILNYALVLIGLVIFVVFGFTKYFDTIKYPLIFFIITPIAEELLFRGWIYEKVEKLTTYSPTIITSLLFGIHHLQYFNYIPTSFALFQIMYTILLGLLLGNIRKLSGSVYLSIFLHIIINYVTTIM